MISLIGIRMFLWSSIAIFGLIPIVVVYSGFAGIIFSRDELNIATPLINGVVIYSAISIASWAFRERQRGLIVRQFRFPNANFVAFLLLLWCMIDLAGGGLSYRQDDVSTGIANRSGLLRIAIISNGAAIVGATYIFLARQHAKATKRILIDVSVFTFLGVLAASGSRGLVLSTLISIFLGNLLKNRAENGPSARVTYSNFLAIAMRKFANLGKTMILAGMALALIAIWGAQRDNYESTSFSFLFRLSEPYWHFSYSAWQTRGADPSLFTDALQRIGSIPMRWFGVQFEGSVDGAEYFLDRYLGIDYKEGVSLPLTLLGHGLLAGGYIGVFLNFFIVAAFATALNRYLLRILHFSPSTIIALLAYQLSKAVTIYPKTLSGAFLYLGYELFRDIIIIFTIATIIRLIGRATNKKPYQSA
ncbi:hypothetical protein [Donghicola tyrosinivorans]|uniref:Oligosaccharide repeat unit polymerase n=1 Tax=Donghicola tyrosinivorans TaxID=1652492 RepID=A0A2T0WDD3_9RHOB|nr:hypothetical protein [Donghicola tyrosinivorans]PRY84719.1 hypothetical protein CLV74_12151 [Donghicola tyrosinivorans]